MEISENFRKRIEKKLKGCPFCGKKPYFTDYANEISARWAVVSCQNYRCAAEPEVNDGTEEKTNDTLEQLILRAVRRWNRRPLEKAA